MQAFLARAALIVTVLMFVFQGCDNHADVVITGKVSKWGKRDTMFVTLTRNWESIRMAPKRFEISKKGEFELEFSVGRNPPPVTFVRNNDVFALLTFTNLRGLGPMAIDEMRNTMHDVKFENGAFRLRLDF